MRKQYKQLWFEKLETRRPLAVTAVDDTYELAENGEIHIGYEQPGYHSLTELGSLNVGPVAQIEFSDRYGLLVIRSLDNKSIKVFDTATRQLISSRSPRHSFSDISLTPDARYIFVTDHLGANAQYNPSFGDVIHRFDCLTRTWEAITSRVEASKIEAISENRVLLHGSNQFVRINLVTFDALKSEIVAVSVGSGPYEGDMEYDSSSGFIYHGSSGSHGTIQVLRVVDDRIHTIQTSDMNFGGQERYSTVLSPNGLTLFYDKLQVEAADVTHSIRRYSEPIIAASDSVAFGEKGSYYDSRNGMLLGKIPFPVSAVHVSENNRDVWIAYNGNGFVYRFQLLQESLGLLANDLFDRSKRATAKIVSQAQYGSAIVNHDGSFSYIPVKDYSGTDSFRYMVTVEGEAVSFATVHLQVNPSVSENRAPLASDLEFHIDRGESLRIEQAIGAFNSGTRLLVEFPAQGNVRQIEYSHATGLLALRNTATKVRIVDPRTQRVISERVANVNFFDMDLTPDGRFLMVADVDSAFPRQPGVGNTSLRTYLHRYDMLNNVWTLHESTPGICHIEAISFDRVLTENCDGPATLTLSSLPAKDGILLPLHADLIHYTGDLEYDSITNQVYHVTSTSIEVIRVTKDRLVRQNSVKIAPYIRRTASKPTLSVDGKRLYVGELQFDTANLHVHKKVLRQAIKAASDELAFGENEIYDSLGNYVGESDSSSDVHFASDDSRSWWIYDPRTKLLRHFALDGKRVGLLAAANDADGDALNLELVDSPRNGSLKLADDKGNVLYTPSSAFTGTDRFAYRVSDGMLKSTVQSVTIHVNDPSPIGSRPTTKDDVFELQVGHQLKVGVDGSDAPQVRKVRDFNTLTNAVQIAVSDRYGVLAAATTNGVELHDLNSGTLISSLSDRAQIKQIDFTPDGRFLFAYEHGGLIRVHESLGCCFYERGISWIHRYDIVANLWVSKIANWEEAGRLAAVSRNRILLVQSAGNRGVFLSDFTDDSQTPLLPLGELIRGPLELHLVYDRRANRAYGVTDRSEIDTLQFTSNAFDQFVNTAREKIAQDIGTPLGKTTTLSSDGRHLYHGGIQVILDNVPYAFRNFPERILAATGELAVGANSFYDTSNSRLVQSLSKPAASAYANSLGTSIWLGAGRSWQQWQTVVATGVLENDSDADGDILRADLQSPPLHGKLQLRPNGSFTYTPNLGFKGTDTFTYVASSSVWISRPTTVTIDVQGTLHNRRNRYDVNADELVTPLDVLTIINALNGANDNIRQQGNFVGFVDVDDNQYVSPMDVLLVINYLNIPTKLSGPPSTEAADQYFGKLEGEESGPFNWDPTSEDFEQRKSGFQPFWRRLGNWRFR